MVKGTTINPPASAKKRYEARARSWLATVASMVERGISDLFSAHDAIDDNEPGITDKATALLRRVRREFDLIAKAGGEEFVLSWARELDRASSAQVFGSLKELSGGLSLPTRRLDAGSKEVLRAAVKENVALIRSIPEDYLARVERMIYTAITEGRTMADIAPALQKEHGKSARKAHLMAADQTRKAMNGLSRGRLERLGVTDYEWIHTGGSAHPRKDHIALSGKTFSLTEPAGMARNKDGEAITPGSEINCRCRFRPVIVFDDGTVF